MGGEALCKGARSPKWGCTQVSTNQLDGASGCASVVPAPCVTPLPVPQGPSSAFPLFSLPGLIGDDLFRLILSLNFGFSDINLSHFYVSSEADEETSGGQQKAL